MSTLVKTASVLDLNYQDRVVADFRSVNENNGYTDRAFRLRRADWVDLGRPDTITITVEPGDQLNS